MADIAKRRSVFITNIPPSSSAAELETFFQQALVALSRTRLLFKGARITMQTFVSQVFRSMTAVINPDITGVVPFHSPDFVSLLERQSGAECHLVDERKEGFGISTDHSQRVTYTLTGTWQQLQCARKIMQECAVDESHYSCTDEGAGQERTIAIASLPPEENVVGETAAVPHDTNGMPRSKGQHSPCEVPGPSLEVDSQPAQRSQWDATGASSLTREAEARGVVDRGRAGAMKGSEEVPCWREEGHANGPPCSFEGQSGKHVSSSSLNKGMKINGNGSGIKNVGTDQSSDFSRQSPRDSNGPNDLMPLASVPGPKESSKEFLSVGSSLDYMKYVKVPQTPFSHYGETAPLLHRPSGDFSQLNRQTTGREASLEVDCGERTPSSLVLTPGTDAEESLGSQGTLPVDPGVFSYLLLKRSDSVRDLEERFGVKFSMNIARDIGEDEIESGLLKITPTAEAAAVEQARDEFILFYARTFESLKLRDITLTDAAINLEALDETLEKIRELYPSVLVTLLQKKVLIYGPKESDVRVAKALVTDAVKDRYPHTDTENQTETENQMGRLRESPGSFDSRSPRMASETVPRPADYSFERRDAVALSRHPGSAIVPGARADPSVCPEPSSQHRHCDLSSAADARRFDCEVGNDSEDLVGMGGQRMESSHCASTQSFEPEQTSANSTPVVNRETPEAVQQPPSHDLIPVDPGVLDFIWAKKHTILRNIEQNYGITFSKKGDLEGEVCLVEVAPQEEASGTDLCGGKDAFVQFYSEVFSGLGHRIVSLKTVVPRDSLMEVVREMEHSFSDVLFRIGESKVLIYGQGRHNIESARDLLEVRLQGGLSPELAVPQDDDESLESLGADAMLSRLDHLRNDSLSPEAHLRHTVAPDMETLRRDPAEGRMNEVASDRNQRDLTRHRSRSPQPQLPLSETKYDGQRGSFQYRDNFGMSSGDLRETPAMSVRPDASASPCDRPTPSGISEGGVTNGETAEVRHQSLDGRLVVELPSGLQVLVYRRDITVLCLDAVVSAANEHLANIGGVAGAIKRAGGQAVEADCRGYITRHGPLRPAQVIHTSAGCLPCKFVLHAVGPCWADYSDKSRCRQILKTTVSNCLRLAETRLLVKSLAMPFISSGLFGVPLDVCIEEICEALLELDRRRLASHRGILQEVHLVDIDMSNIKVAQDLVSAILCPKVAGINSTAPVGVREGPPTLGAESNISWEQGNVSNEDSAALADDEDEGALGLRGHRQKRASAVSKSSRGKSSSCFSKEEDVSHENVQKTRADDRRKTHGRPVVKRSMSLPYLASDGSGDPSRASRAHRTAPLTSRDPKESSQAWERGLETEHTGSSAKASTSQETREAERVRKLIDRCSSSSRAPSPRLSRTTEYELNRIFTEQEREIKGKQSRPKRRSHSLDRRRLSPAQDKCFICSSTKGLSRRRACEHMICEVCQRARLDVGECKLCGREKPEKKCGWCSCSTRSLLLDCKDCRNPVCIYCIQQHMDRCPSCTDRGLSSASSVRHKEKKQPKLKEPIIAPRSSHIDSKNEYRIKNSANDTTSAHRRKPILGTSHPSDADVRPYGSRVRGDGNGVVVIKYESRCRELVSEEAPHEEALRCLSREEDTWPRTSTHDASGHHPSSAESPAPKRHPKASGRAEDLPVVGQASASISKQDKATCAICLDRMRDPKTLDRCSHTFCSACIERSLQFKPLCPICGMSYGMLQGDQPAGSMNYTTVSTDLPGHPGCGTIIITYNFANGIQGEEHPNPGLMYHGTRREAYLPNSQEGLEVLCLLQRAFEDRLLFTVGRSVTTGQENMLVWNDVHHKTRQTGGAVHHGYPDPDYLQRVKEELAAKGIK